MENGPMTDDPPTDDPSIDDPMTNDPPTDDPPTEDAEAEDPDAGDQATGDPDAEQSALAEDGSLESFERRYQASKGGSLSELEDRYQHHKVLRSGEPVSARITDAGVDDRIALEVTVAGATSFVLPFERTVPDMVALYDCYRLVGVEYGHDLAPLIGQEVTVTFETDALDELTLGEGPLSITRAVVDAPADLSDATEFPERIADATARLAHYAALSDAAVRAPVVAAWADGDTLAIQADLLGTVARIDVPVPQTHEMAGSDFERVVETVGHGSVQQIADGTLYAVRADHLDDSIGAVDRAIGTVDDWATTWALYAVEGNAEMLVDVSSLAAEHVVPERAAAGTDRVAADDRQGRSEAGHRGGSEDDRRSGPNGEMDEGGDGDVGENDDSGGEGSADSEANESDDSGREEGASSDVDDSDDSNREEDTNSDADENDDRPIDDPDAVTTVEARRRQQAGPEHHVAPGLVEPFAGALDRDEVVHYVGKGGPIEIRTDGDVEQKASFTGYERIAVTDRRVLLKSSRVLGTDLYTVPYTEVDGASLRSGILDDEIVVSVTDGEYRISVIEPDTGSCRDLVSFVEEQAEG